MQAKPKLLLVDDDAAVINSLTPFLERAGFSVAVAMNGDQGLQKVTLTAPDLIVLDILMPKMDGREMLRHLRAEDNWTPVILLTRVDNTAERTMALDEGADDYLNKPFDPPELVARIRAVLRRSRPGKLPLYAARHLTSGDLLLDRTARRVRLAAQELLLTPKAVAILEYLMTHPDELIKRERLLDAVWGWDNPVGTRVVDTRIAELRKALRDDPMQPRYIETVSGEGYRFVAPVENVS